MDTIEGDEEIPDKDRKSQKTTEKQVEADDVPKTVKKGDEEYTIVVTGVKDTGLCGNYWNVSDSGRRRSRPPETLQMGKEKRRGSVGSVGSETSGKDSPASKKGAATPVSARSNKKQVTKPEKVEPEEVEETPTSKAKSAKKEVE